MKQLAVAGAAIVLVLAALEGTAMAKPFVRATVCGASRCAELSGTEVYSLYSTGLRIRSPRPAPFFTVSLREAERPGTASRTFRLLYAPSRGAWRGITYQRRPVWTKLPPDVAALMKRATARSAPYSASVRWSPGPSVRDDSAANWLLPIGIGAALGGVLAALGIRAVRRGCMPYRPLRE